MCQLCDPFVRGTCMRTYGFFGLPLSSDTHASMALILVLFTANLILETIRSTITDTVVYTTSTLYYHLDNFYRSYYLYPFIFSPYALLFLRLLDETILNSWSDYYWRRIWRRSSDWIWLPERALPPARWACGFCGLAQYPVWSGIFPLNEIHYRYSYCIGGDSRVACWPIYNGIPNSHPLIFVPKMWNAIFLVCNAVYTSLDFAFDLSCFIIRHEKRACVWTFKFVVRVYREERDTACYSTPVIKAFLWAQSTYLQYEASVLDAYFPNLAKAPEENADAN